MGISLRVTNPAQSTTMGLQHIFLMERDSFPPLPSMHPQTHTPIQISSLYLYAAHRQAAVVSKSHSYMPLATSGDGCGDGTRTHDLQLMRLTSYQLLHPAVYIKTRIPIYNKHDSILKPRCIFFYILARLLPHQ